MSTPVLVCGFEIGTVAGTVDANNGKAPGANRYSTDPAVGTPAILSPGRTGGYFLRLTGAANAQNIDWGTAILGASKTFLTMSVWIRTPTSLPAALTRLLQIETTDGSGTAATISYNPTGTRLEAKVSAGTTQAGPAIVAGQWYRLDLKFDVSTTTYKLDWSADGQPQVQATGTGTNLTIAFLTLGWGAAATATWDYDDLVVYTDTAATNIPHPVGSHKVVALSPDSNVGSVTLSGTAANWNVFSGATPTESAWNATTALTNVDDVPPNLGSSQDGFDQITAAAGDFVEIPLTTYILQPGEIVAGARVCVPMWAAGATHNFRIDTFNGSVSQTEFSLAATGADNTAFPAWICHMMTILGTSIINTQEEINAHTVRGGFATTTTNHVGMHGAFIELAIQEGSYNVMPATRKHGWPGRGPRHNQRFRKPKLDTTIAPAGAPPSYTPDWILQHSDGRRRVSITRRGSFFFPGQNFPPRPWVPPLIMQTQQRMLVTHRGNFFFTGPPVVAPVVTTIPQFLTRRRQWLGRIRDGQFFFTGPTIPLPPKILTQRRQALPLLRRGRIYSIVPAVVVASAVWSPPLITPAQRRLLLRPRRGQFYSPGQNFPPRPWLPSIIQQPTQHRTLMIRRGRFFAVPVPVVVIVVATPPSFLTQRRQRLMPVRRGRFMERPWGPPTVCPATIARRRAGLPPVRRGRFYWHGQNFPAMPPIVHRIRRVYRPGLPQARFRNRFYLVPLVPPSEVWATGESTQSGAAGASRTGGPAGSTGQSGAAGHGNLGDPEHGKVVEEHVEGSVRLH